MDIDISPAAASRLSTIHDVRRALHPLQAQADRVGRQVEEFAETLDRLTSLRDDEFRDSSKILPIVQRYESIAKDTVVRLKRRHGDQKTQLWREHRRRKLNRGSALVLYKEDDEDSAPSSTTVRDLWHWEQERQTWELLNLMLQVQHKPHEAADVTDFTPLERPQDLHAHQYSSEYSVYQKYLATHDSAWERHVIREWLERCADESREKVDDVLEVLDAENESSSKTPAAKGWIASKEAIKGQKRIRTLAYALTPDQLDSYKNIVSIDKNKRTITQMDPDVATRQGRDLLPADLAYERLTWIGCWELLRRGKAWEDIQEWCEERDDGWRALTLRADPRLGQSKQSAAGTLSGRASWQQLCLWLARSGGYDDYERAVYGMLGGDHKSVYNVCKTWDDQLHGYLSCQLSQGFGTYFNQHFQLRPDVDIGPDARQNVANESLRSFLEGLSEAKGTSEESLSPFRALQAAVMKNDPVPHLRNQGLNILPQLRQMKYSSLNLQAFKDSTEQPTGPTSAISVDDHDLIRILAHVVIFHQYLNPDQPQSPAMENLIEAYVDFLSKAGKQQLLPLYASFLSDDRAAASLARQLPFVKDTAERQILVRLMDRYGMDSVIVLLCQLDSIVTSTPAPPEFDQKFPALELLEPQTNLRDARNLRPDLIGGELQPWQEDLVDTLEWFLLLKGNDRFTVYSAGIVAYKHLLRTKSYAALCRLAQQIRSERIAEVVELPGQVNGHSGPAGLHSDDEDEMDVDSKGWERKKIKMQSSRENDLADVKIFQDLESLALVLQALGEWEQVVHDGERARMRAQEGDKTELKPWKKDLQARHDLVSERMQPLLHGWLLPAKGKTDTEMQELRSIRRQMLPELVLAYLSVLSFAGAWSGRENLLQCMNLARDVADEDKDLFQTLVDAGRMAELMTSMAGISRQILAAQETTGTMKMRKRRGAGELLDIWSVDAETDG